MALAPWHTFQILTKRPERMLRYMTEPVKGAWAGRVFQIDDAGVERPESDARFRLHSIMVNMFVRVPPETLNRAAEWQDEHYPDGDGFLRAWPLPNVWLGVSVEDQATADARIPLLLQTPAASRSVSYEPALGPVDFDSENADGLHALGCGYDGPWRECPTLKPSCTGIDWLIVGGESGPGRRELEVAWVESAYDQCKAAGVPIFVKQDSGPKPGMQGRIPDRLWVKEFPCPSAEDVIVAALAARFAAPQYAFLPQVRDPTGWAAGRTADALAMSLWPSRGLDLIGFEIKVSRADWLRELKQPEKAESIFRFCDRWYVVVPDAAIIASGELPSTWGLIVTTGDRAKVVIEAPKLEPQPLSRPFLAAVLRRGRRLRRMYKLFLRNAVHEFTCRVKNGDPAWDDHFRFDFAASHPFRALQVCTCWIGDLRRVGRGQRPRRNP